MKQNSSTPKPRGEYMSNSAKIKFFLGSNTKRGFISLFDELRDPANIKRLYIIKGGPGSGKSFLMKKTANALEEKKHTIEYFPCASDPDSLDGFYDHDAGIAMMDGTAPHVIDPVYSGAYEVIVNMAGCWDDSALFEHREEIISLSDTISDCHFMAASYIGSAAALLDANMRLAAPYVRHNMVNDIVSNIFIPNIVSRVKKKGKSPNPGGEKKRLLSAVSVGETVFCDETIKALSDTVYVIRDNWGAASNMLLIKLRQAASLTGIEQVVCFCSIRTPDKIEHIIFPSAGITVTTANSFHSVGDSYDGNHIIIDGIMEEIPKVKHMQMSINLEKAAELVYTAGEHVRQAKLLHDDLEAYYIKAMDFSRADTIYSRIQSEITDL